MRFSFEKLTKRVRVLSLASPLEVKNHAKREVRKGFIYFPSKLTSGILDFPLREKAKQCVL